MYLQSVELVNVDNMMDVKMDLIQSEPLVVAPDFLELKEIGKSHVMLLLFSLWLHSFI